MMPKFPEEARQHYDYINDLQTEAERAILKLMPLITPLGIESAAKRVIPTWAAKLRANKLAAAGSVDEYLDATSASLGEESETTGLIVAAAYADTTARGGSIEKALWAPINRARKTIDSNGDALEALHTARQELQRFARTDIADTARSAATAGITARKHGGYVRMLNMPSCRNCVILAGKFFRWNQGFQRHPRCDCIHIPSSENLSGDLTTDPYEAFNSMNEAQQDKAFGKGAALAIREGGDIFQVVNAQRIRSDLTTATGMTFGPRGARGFAGERLGKGATRLTPEGILLQAGEDRALARELLVKNGYITPFGQVPGGALRGQREGFGQMGHGGTRTGAKQAVLDARLAGVRDPTNRATMTAAERRASDPRAYSSSGGGSENKPPLASVFTDEIDLPKTYLVTRRDGSQAVLASPWADGIKPSIPDRTVQHVVNRHGVSSTRRNANVTFYAEDPAPTTIYETAAAVLVSPAAVTRQGTTNLWKLRGRHEGVLHEVIVDDGVVTTMYPVGGHGVTIIRNGTRVALIGEMTWKGW